MGQRPCRLSQGILHIDLRELSFSSMSPAILARIDKTENPNHPIIGNVRVSISWWRLMDSNHRPPAHGVPERTAVFRRGAASLFLTSRGRRLARQRGVDRLRKLRIQSGLPFQTVNLLAEIYYIGLHLFIGRHILGGQQAIRTTLGIQKSLRRFPRLCPLLAQFQNRHSRILLNASKD